MSYGLNNIENTLYREYNHYRTMEASLRAKLIHTAGGIVMRKSKTADSPLEAYYVYKTNGRRHSKRIHPEELEACQNEIQTLKQREQALKHTKEQLTRIEKCMKAINFDPEAYEQQQKKTRVQPKQQNLNVPYPEHLRHNTLSGIKVRSKSEALLADLFFAFNVHFEYEKEIKLGNTTLYPDFTIIAPDGRVFYWEHLGMLENEDYARNWARKQAIYMRNGISEGNGLIITRDTNGIFDTEDAIYKIRLHNLSHNPQ